MEKEHWSVDKKIPLALIVTMVLQLAGVVWWGSDISTRITDVEKHIDTEMVTNTQAKGAHSLLQLQLDNEKEVIKEIKMYLTRIDSKLDRMLDKHSKD